jgi:hypothetical protein
MDTPIPVSEPVRHSSKGLLWAVVGLLVLGGVGVGVSRWMGDRTTKSLTGVNGDRNDDSATYSNEQGSVTVGGSAMPENWPSDAPGAVAGAAIQYSGASSPAGEAAGLGVVYTVAKPSADVVAYYKTELAAKGWTIEGNSTIGTVVVLSAKKGKNTLGVQVVTTDTKNTQVTLGLQVGK